MKVSLKLALGLSIDIHEFKHFSGARFYMYIVFGLQEPSFLSVSNKLTRTIITISKTFFQ